MKTTLAALLLTLATQALAADIYWPEFRKDVQAPESSVEPLTPAVEPEIPTCIPANKECETP